MGIKPMDFDDDFSSLNTKDILLTYAKKIYESIAEKPIDFEIEVDDQGLMKIYNALEKDGNLLINIIDTVKLRAIYLTDDEYEMENKQGIGSNFNRSSRSYLTH